MAKLIKWARMKFKAARSKGVSLTKGRVSSQSFTIGDEHIPTLWQQPVKCLGGWYALPLTERHHGKEIHKVLSEGLQPIENLGLPGKFKVWWLSIWTSVSDSLVHAVLHHHYDQDGSYGTPGKQPQMAWCTKELHKWCSIFLFSQANTSNHVSYRGIQGGKGKAFPDDPWFQWSSCSKREALSVLRQEVFAEAAMEAESRLQLKEIVRHVRQDPKRFRWS